MATQPVLFVSHGSPMLALAPPEHPYPAALAGFAGALAEAPRAVLVVSAHWQGEGPGITAAARPGVMYDFYGFPPELSALDYPAPGAPALAGRIAELLAGQGWQPRLDPVRALDHGAWAVLRHLFPAADVPVLQVSLPELPPARLQELGRALGALRAEGVLILASGGLVHNLRTVDWQAEDGVAAAWAMEAEAWLMERLEAGDLAALGDHRRLWPGSARAAATTEHLDPLFVAVGAGSGPVRTVFQGWQLGTMSLRCLAWD
jgi:4,5-DOPA dioxygenase extradiol